MISIETLSKSTKSDRHARAQHAAAMAEQSTAKDEAKTPFTIITGFLGAGKTTLINYILTEQRDKRICVIENEFGEINIDEKLVSANMASKEDLIQMDNGCACCSIRGDLVRTLGGLVEKRQQFDAVMLETTGLADPAPIIATLKSNQWIDDNFAIDAVFASADLQFVRCGSLDTVACVARRSWPSLGLSEGRGAEIARRGYRPRRSGTWPSSRTLRASVADRRDTRAWTPVPPNKWRYGCLSR